MKDLTIIFLLFFFIITSGYATLLTGTRDTISFNSTPQEAIVYEDGIQLVRIPFSVPIKRSPNRSEIEFRTDDYETMYLTPGKEMNLVSLMNMGNMFGWTVNASTGSQLRYKRKSYDMEMGLSSLGGASIITEIRNDTRKDIVDIYSNQNK